jgi:hypothetical protein
MQSTHHRSLNALWTRLQRIEDASTSIHSAFRGKLAFLYMRASKQSVLAEVMEIHSHPPRMLLVQSVLELIKTYEDV